MASVILSSAGSALGASLLPEGLSFAGMQISGEALGNTLGSALGDYLDQRLLGSGLEREGPRLSELTVQASTEGAAIPRAFGRVRLSGQVIWASNFRETAHTSGGGGKGGGASSVQTTTYAYSVSLAIGLCEGPITRIGRVWADGNLLDLSDLTYRVYLGTESQVADSTLESVQGTGAVPAYRGLAYVVFEDLPLTEFGNRVPQLSFEVFRALGDVEGEIKAVTLIPGSSEFGYDTVAHRRIFADGVSQAENAHTGQDETDFQAALDDLQATCPNVQSVALVISWFGNDLRCGTCALKPKVEKQDKVTVPTTWSVAGEDRSGADAVSQVEGRPAYGGTPSDGSVINAITELKARGLSVAYYPFVMMDIPAGSGLPDPYGGAEQAAHPWRGRITVSPAPGLSGTPDKTAAATLEVAAFFGTATASDFSVASGTVTYTGPDEWSYCRMVLHNAALCAAAGGVDRFLIGSELRGLTHIRSDASTYPAVQQLISLAAQVRTLLGPATKISYGADWSEYFGHQPQDGSGDVFFHLDPLWADPNIDFVGIDNYMPLSDRRDEGGHLDEVAGVPSHYDLDYLKGNIAGGEGFDWFYASAADREAQVRTPITDGAYGKPWIYRYKDLKSWWSNSHYDRPGGVEAASPTQWQPQSKPILFSEIGFPAVDKGTNQPNVFVDPKSSESHLPYFSNGGRDDYGQRQGLKAVLQYWNPVADGFQEEDNPISPVYGGRMVDPDHLYVWTWDARPFPSFPQLTSVWSDGANWRLGHWLTGRLGSVPLSRLVEVIAMDVPDISVNVADLTGVVDGFVIDRIMAPRRALEPLMLAFFFGATESGNRIHFRQAGGRSLATLEAGETVSSSEDADASPQFTRGQETELPETVKLTFLNPDEDYRQASVEARRAHVHSQRVATASLPLVIRPADAQRIAEVWLHDTWVRRDRASFVLPPSRMRLEPGDVITLRGVDREETLTLTSLSDGGAIAAQGVCTEASVFGGVASPERPVSEREPITFGTADCLFLDLPMRRETQTPLAPYVAVSASPWPGGIALYRSLTGEGYSLDSIITSPATMGRLTVTLASGPVAIWDQVNEIHVALSSGALASASRGDVLNGANLAAVESAAGGWEVVQFADVELVAPDQYVLRSLLRGQGGTEADMGAEIGARFVLLDEAVAQVRTPADEIGRQTFWHFGPHTHARTRDTYLTRTVTAEGTSLRPLSSVHVAARRLANGDVALSWVRRTRLGGDSWSDMDVPLGEEQEAYEVDVIANGVVARTLTATSPQVLYMVAEQTVDFGGPVSGALTVEVFQLSAAYGRGRGGRGVLML